MRNPGQLALPGRCYPNTPLYAGLSLWLPFNDLGNGQVDIIPFVGKGLGTFARATPASTILRNGLLAQVASGIPRARYAPGAGNYQGYFAEPASTNLLLQSSGLDTGSWTKNNCTITPDATVAPDGTTTADSLVPTVAGGNVMQGIVKAASALPYTGSVFVKPGQKTWAVLSLYDGAANGIRFWFNLTGAGVIGSSVAIGTPFTAASATITAHSNGWYRITVTATSDTTTVLQMFMQGGNSDTVFSTTTSGTDVIFWGAQLEQLAFVTSYIATTVAAVTRSGDVLTYPMTGNGSAAAGTAYAEISTSWTGAAPGAAAVVIGFDGAGQPLAVSTSTNSYIYDGTTSVIKTPLAESSTGTRKHASSWSGVSMGSTGDGLAETTGTFDGTMGASASIGIGVIPGGANPLCGTLKNVNLWTRALSSAEKITLTT